MWSVGPCDLRRSSFARNSLESVSGFEIGSLIFRGFRAVDEWGPGGITCDFGEGGDGAGVWWGAWRGRGMGHMARGVARGMWRWGEVRGCADDRVKGLPCGT